MKYAVKGILCYHVARRGWKYPHDILVIDQEPQKLHLTGPIDVVRTLNDDEKDITKRYRKGKLFIAVVILDHEGKVVKYSSTSCYEV